MIINFLKKVFLIDLLQGLSVTLKYQFTHKVTIQYPEKVKESRERFRGILRVYRDGEGKQLCIACKICQKACPEDCFDIEGQKNTEDNKMRPVKFDWKLYRCSFCGLCQEACPTDAIKLSKEFRMATRDKSKLFFTLDQMYSDYDLNKHFRGESKK